jgi:hypothetical protein
MTGRDGRIVFPARYVTMFALRIAAGSVGNVLRSLHEASFGPSGFVLIGAHEARGREGCEALGYPRGATKAEGAHREPLSDSCVLPDSFSTFEQ